MGNAVTHTAIKNSQPPDRVLVDIADYVLETEVRSADALETAAVATLTSTTWSRPTRLKLLPSARTP